MQKTSICIDKDHLVALKMACSELQSEVVSEAVQDDRYDRACWVDVQHPTAGTLFYIGVTMDTLLGMKEILNEDYADSMARLEASRRVDRAFFEGRELSFEDALKEVISEREILNG